MKSIVYIVTISILMFSCQLDNNGKKSNSGFPWEENGKLVVNEGSRIIQYEDGTPFLWIGCTSWGMTEWLTREKVDLYLDDRQSKGMNVVQLCLFWGKRRGYPIKTFTVNPSNAYGYKSFVEKNGMPDVLQPAVIEGGSPENSNDYWDHVDYCIQAIKKRGMYAAVLPFWGRRYVNATYKGQSLSIFTLENIFQYGQFLGERYSDEPNIIWVNGGDVKADAGGDFTSHYRLFAEGLVKGVTGKSIKWNEESDAWDSLLITYHPDGSPMINSSNWFQNDPWLTFDMIETHVARDKITASIRQDLAKEPLKPTVMAEGQYEGYTNGKFANAIHIRRQAYQSFFAGAAGYTYGATHDEEGNGPLMSPANNWEHLLNLEGAGQLIYLKEFLEKNTWWNWEPYDEIILEGRGTGELEKLAVKSDRKILIYFPENSICKVNLGLLNKYSWLNTATGESVDNINVIQNEFSPPEGWEDAVLILIF
jgi:Protein of unknown function (DUF4038)